MTGPLVVRHTGPDGSVLFLQAFETVEAARECAAREVDRAEPFGGAPYGEWAHARWEAERLQAEGGSIRLPDGSTITVEATTWDALLSRRATLELVIVRALASADSLDHELIWNGYATEYSSKAVSFALQQLKRSGFVHAPEQRGWWELNRPAILAAWNAEHAIGGEAGRV